MLYSEVIVHLATHVRQTLFIMEILSPGDISLLAFVVCHGSCDVSSCIYHNCEPSQSFSVQTIGESACDFPHAYGAEVAYYNRSIQSNQCSLLKCK